MLQQTVAWFMTQLPEFQIQTDEEVRHKLLIFTGQRMTSKKTKEHVLLFSSDMRIHDSYVTKINTEQKQQQVSPTSLLTQRIHNGLLF